MLTTPEKIFFILLSVASALAALRAADRIRRVIRRGWGKVNLVNIVGRAVAAAVKAGTFQPTWKTRLVPSLLHALVGWAFIFYLLVNLGDVLEGLLPDYIFLGGPLEGVGHFYRLAADVLSVGALVGMAALLARRFVARSRALRFRPNTTVYPRAPRAILRDSAIVGGFILVHVGSRFLGDSFHLAEDGVSPWQPFASLLSRFGSRSTSSFGARWAPSCCSSPTSCTPSTSTCSWRRSTSC
jgi:hypothetical protein